MGEIMDSEIIGRIESVKGEKVQSCGLISNYLPHCVCKRADDERPSSAAHHVSFNHVCV